MGTIATLLGALLVATPVPVQVCDTAGCRVQSPNVFTVGCRVQVHASVATLEAGRARWTLTVHRLDGMLTAVTVTRSFGSTVLWSGTQAYWTSSLVAPTQGAGWVAVQARDSGGCVTATRLDLHP